MKIFLSAVTQEIPADVLEEDAHVMLSFPDMNGDPALPNADFQKLLDFRTDTLRELIPSAPLPHNQNAIQ